MLSVKIVSATLRCSKATFRVPFGADGRRRLWVVGLQGYFGAWKGGPSLDSGFLRFAEQ